MEKLKVTQKMAHQRSAVMENGGSMFEGKLGSRNVRGVGQIFMNVKHEKDKIPDFVNLAQ